MICLRHIELSSLYMRVIVPLMPIYEHAPFVPIYDAWRHIEVRQHTHMELTDLHAADAMTHWANDITELTVSWHTVYGAWRTDRHEVDVLIVTATYGHNNLLFSPLASRTQRLSVASVQSILNLLTLVTFYNVHYTGGQFNTVEHPWGTPVSQSSSDDQMSDS